MHDIERFLIKKFNALKVERGDEEEKFISIHFYEKNSLEVKTLQIGVVYKLGHDFLRTILYWLHIFCMKK